MKVMRFTKFPLHIFLLPVFFVWHVVNQYFGLIPFRFSGLFLLYYLGLALFLFLIGKLMLKNTIKAGCWATTLLIIFFFWGTAHDFLKAQHPPAFFISYIFLFAVVFLFVVFITWQLRKNQPPLKLNRFLTLLLTLFVLMEGVLSVYKLATKQLQKNNLAYYNQPVQPDLAKSPNQLKPDVFLVFFDEYPGSAALRQYLDFNNSLLDSLLEKNNFFLAGKSKSNYNLTPLSIASVLDLDYFNTPMEGDLATPRLMLQGEGSVTKSLFPKLLEKEGYRIINRGLFKLGNHVPPTRPIYDYYRIEALYLETLWGRVSREIWWKIARETLLKFSIEPPFNDPIDYAGVNAANFRSVSDELKKQDSIPKFVFSHFMLPHFPFLVDRYGNKRKDLYHSAHSASVDSLFLDQVIYANTLIDSLAGITNQKFPRPRIVIFLGDHGYRDTKNDPDSRDKQFMNLSATYFSDGDYSGVYDSISPVNTLRVVLNKYFDASLPLLKDSTIRLRIK